MSLKKQLLRDSGWMLFSRVAGAVVGLAVTSLLTRILSQEQVGTYFLSLSAAMMFATIAGLGLPRTATRLLAETTTAQFNTNRRAILVACAALLISFSVPLAWVYYHIVGDWVARRLFHSVTMASIPGYIAVWFVLLALRQLVEESFRGLGDIRAASVFSGWMSNSIAILILGIGVILEIHLGLAQVVLAVIVGLVTSVSVGAVMLRQESPKELGNETVAIQSILAIALPIFIMNAMQFVLAQSNIWILGAVSAKAQVALYGAVTQFATLISFPFIIANNAIPQLIVKFNAAREYNKLENLLRTIATASSIPAGILVIGVILLGRPVLEFVYGAGYGAAEPALVWLALGQLAGVMAGPCGIVLVMTGHQRINVTVATVTGLLVVPLAIYLAVQFGTTGAAASAALAMAAQNLMLALFAKRQVGVRSYISFSPNILRHFQLGNLR